MHLKKFKFRVKQIYPSASATEEFDEWSMGQSVVLELFNEVIKKIDTNELTESKAIQRLKDILYLFNADEINKRWEEYEK
tara:strand:- start:2195 stop:2434 length:240 start_codon:yes stop_codon:yes gene_type:complete